MSTTQENNKRIAKNTLFLYFRQLLVMAVSLYTVRIVLAELGEEDYGIYNVVGGFVAMFNILSGALSVAIVRFLTYEMGLTDLSLARLRGIFSSSVIIQIGLGLIISLLIGLFGVWFVEHKMVLPSGRLDVTLYVLFFSTLSFFINLLSIPYNALIIAHERMNAFAYIAIVEGGLNLLMAFLLIVVPVDKLGLYAFCKVIIALTVRGIYVFYCKSHFEECRFVWEFDRRLLSRMFAFSGWAFLGNGVVVLKDQGSNILLNLFGGPVVNAAQGIAAQVNTAAYSFVSNFMLAANPQITKNYASGALDTMYAIIIKSTKFGFFILLLIVLPLCAGIHSVLRLWLVEVPDHTANFVMLILVYSLVDCLLSPLTTGMIAQGEIKNFEIRLSFIYSGNFIASYLCLRSGMPVEVVFVLNILFKMIVLVSLLWHARTKFHFPVMRFLSECVLPIGAVFPVSVLFAFILPGRDDPSFGILVVRSLVIIIFTGMVVYLVGMSRIERAYIRGLLREKLLKRLYNSDSK
ncbi:lipopolysaccharide biosynthesis protein [Parabacteroides distasonis]|uniref:lipopolysaccharide biosynthesis protein n=1 Tax=Parabacteroides distasonis TaxID=823 RepID=UPI00321A676B